MRLWSDEDAAPTGEGTSTFGKSHPDATDSLPVDRFTRFANA